MTFPKIETIYGLYSRGKLGRLAPGLDYQGVYDAVSGKLSRILNESERRQRANASPFQMGKAALKDDETTRLAVLRLSSPEIYWLGCGRLEFRMTPGFISRAMHMAPEFPVGSLFKENKRRVARMTWPKNALCCGLVCAYVEIIDISVMAEDVRATAIEHYGEHQVQVSISECVGVSPLDSLPHPRVVCTGNLDESLTLILARHVLGDLASAYLPLNEESVDKIRERYKSHDTDIRHGLSIASICGIAFHLYDQNHRFVKKTASLVTPRRRGLPSEPVPFLIGEGLSLLPRSRDRVTPGAATWEKFEGDDGQILFTWPVEVEPTQEPANILENDDD